MSEPPTTTARQRQRADEARARGRRLVAEYLAQGCDRVDIERRSGVAATTLAAIENGDRLNPHRSTIARIAAAFPRSLDPVWLYSGEGEQYVGEAA